MARSDISMRVYNALYGLLKSSISQRGLSFKLKTFNDGSAVANIIITARNVSVELSAVIVPIYDTREDEKIVGWRASDDNFKREYKTLPETVNFVRSMISESRSVLNKI